MHMTEGLLHTFEEIRQLVGSTVEGLDADELLWRPDPGANSIAWLIWHLTRVQDHHVSELADQEQAWTAGGRAPQFGLPPGAPDTGFGHTPEQVAAVRPDHPELLIAYHDDVARGTTDYLRALDDDRLDRVIDESYDPPVTVGIRLTSVIIDSLQHVGQAAYVRGMMQRRT